MLDTRTARCRVQATKRDRRRNSEEVFPSLVLQARVIREGQVDESDMATKLVDWRWSGWRLVSARRWRQRRPTSS